MRFLNNIISFFRKGRESEKEVIEEKEDDYEERKRKEEEEIRKSIIELKKKEKEIEQKIKEICERVGILYLGREAFDCRYFSEKQSTIWLHIKFDEKVFETFLRKLKEQINFVTFLSMKTRLWPEGGKFYHCYVYEYIRVNFGQIVSMDCIIPIKEQQWIISRE